MIFGYARVSTCLSPLLTGQIFWKGCVANYLCFFPFLLRCYKSNRTVKPMMVVMEKITPEHFFGGFGRPTHNSSQIHCAQSHHVPECCEKLQCTSSLQGWPHEWIPAWSRSFSKIGPPKRLPTEWAMNWLPLSLRKMTPFSSWFRFIRRKRLIKSIWRILPWNSQSRILRLYTSMTLNR